MEFEATRPPNFIKIRGTETRVDIGALDEKEFYDFSRAMTDQLALHWQKRKEMIKDNLSPMQTTSPN